MSRSSFKRPRLDEPSTSTGSSSTSIVPISLSNAYNADEDDDDDHNSDSDGQDDFEFAEGYNDHAGTSSRDSGDEGDGWSEDEDEGGRSGKGTPAKGHTSSASHSRPSTPSSSKKTPTKRKAATPRKSPKSQSKPKPAASSGPFVRLTASDAYFTSVAQPLALNTLSSNIFSSLLPPLTHQAYTSLLAASSVAHKHEHELDDLSVEHERRWDGWVHELTSGWNLLFYGLGSKRDALNDFAVDRLSEEGDIVVVNGLYPRIGIREILAAIEEQFPELNKLPPPPTSFSLSTSSSTTTSTPLDVLAYKIYTYFLPLHTLPPSAAKTTKLASKPLFLLLHSLDSPSLRTPQSKSILSLLASSPRIHLLASIDNINAPSLFTTTELYSRPHSYPSYSPSSDKGATTWPPVPPPTRGFNFLLHDLTTLRPYTDEVSWRTSSASRLSSGAGGGGAGGGAAGTATEEGARHILISVTGAAKKLFKLLSKNQIAAQSSSSSSSIKVGSSTPAYATETSLFFHQCAAEWIAREETRFKALLAEFRDHRLVVESTIAPGQSGGGEEADGGGGGGGKGKANARWLWIPLGKEALERLVAEIEAEE